MLITIYYHCLIHWSDVLKEWVLRIYSLLLLILRILNCHISWFSKCLHHQLHIKFLRRHSIICSESSPIVIRISKIILFLKLGHVFVISHWQIVLIYKSAFRFCSGALIETINRMIIASRLYYFSIIPALGVTLLTLIHWCLHICTNNSLLELKGICTLGSHSSSNLIPVLALITSLRFQMLILFDVLILYSWHLRYQILVNRIKYW